MEEAIVLDFWEIDESEELCALAKKVIKKCYQNEKMVNPNLGINIIFTNPEKIKELNEKHRNISKPTDVLSFPMFEKEEIEKIKQTKQIEILGDIVISVEQVRKQAVEYGNSFEREFSYMLVHGFYHLLGYDHIEENDKKQMRIKEEEVLREGI